MKNEIKKIDFELLTKETFERNQNYQNQKYKGLILPVVYEYIDDNNVPVELKAKYQHFYSIVSVVSSEEKFDGINPVIVEVGGLPYTIVMKKSDLIELFRVTGFFG